MYKGQDCCLETSVEMNEYEEEEEEEVEVDGSGFPVPSLLPSFLPTVFVVGASVTFPRRGNARNEQRPTVSL